MKIMLSDLILALQHMKDRVGDVQVMVPFPGVSQYDFAHAITGYNMTLVGTDPTGDQGVVHKVKSIGAEGATGVVIDLT